jgi:hypothetical protein
MCLHRSLYWPSRLDGQTRSAFVVSLHSLASSRWYQNRLATGTNTLHRTHDPASTILPLYVITNMSFGFSVGDLVAVSN